MNTVSSASAAPWGTPPPVVLKNARVIDPSRRIDERGSVMIADRRIVACGADAGEEFAQASRVYDCAGAVVAPGLVDMRVFVGEPGFEYRETLASASMAAAAGGVSTFVCMPDTEPVIDDSAIVDFILRRARDTARVKVLPSAALTQALAGERVAELGLLHEAGAVAFSQGRGVVRNAQVMRLALTYARDFDALAMHRPEDTDLAAGGVMNESEVASRLGLGGRPWQAETIMLERDLQLAGLTGARYHAALLSCAPSIAIMRRAKASLPGVSCAVSINNLCLNENDIGPYRTFFKLSPPLRHEDDRRALVDGLADGTIDAIVSNHDPQDADTKRHPFAQAADGAIGLETLLCAALRLFHSGDIDLINLLAALTCRPADLLGLDTGRLQPGRPADLVVFDPHMPWSVSESTIHSRSKNTPFEDTQMQGRVLATFVNGNLVYGLREPFVDGREG